MKNWYKDSQGMRKIDEFVYTITMLAYFDNETALNTYEMDEICSCGG